MAYLLMLVMASSNSLPKANKMQHTKIVLSLEADKLKEHTAKLISSYSYDALRIIYKQQETDCLLSFLKKYRDEQKNSESLAYKPIIVDVSHKNQGTVVGLAKDIELAGKKELTFVPEGSKEKGIQIQTSDWENLFKEGEKAYLNNGNVILQMTEVLPKKALAQVQQGLRIRNDLVVTVPATQKPPSVFDLAFIDTEPFQNLEIDYVLLPGISRPKHLDLIKKRLSSSVKHTPSLILKVDSEAVCNNIDALLDSVDGVCLSRRPLALSIHPARVPIVCKEIINKATQKAKIVLMSSETLYSMKRNLTPTRAEVSDIANATVDGIDAIMLSKGIAYGPHTKKALQIAKKTILAAESSSGLKANWLKTKRHTKDFMEIVSYHACSTARRLQAKALVCLTEEGITALQIASYRPKIPIFALTFAEKTKRRLSLVRGVRPIRLEKPPNLDDLLPEVSKVLVEWKLLKRKDLFVFVTPNLSPISKETSNLFTIQEII